MYQINYDKKCTVPMVSNETGRVEFNLTIFGRTADELMVVPCDVTNALVNKYPDHHSSMFMVY